MRKQIFTALLVSGWVALGTAAQADDMPTLVIVSPETTKAVAAQALAAQIGLQSKTVSAVSSVSDISENNTDMIILEYADRAPDQKNLAEQLDALSGLPHRTTYMLFAETAADREPLVGLQAPENVKFVVAVRALDQAVVAKSHAAAGTGYDGSQFHYDTFTAVRMATEQLKSSQDANAQGNSAKGWQAGVHYMLFDKDVVHSGAPDKAVEDLLDYTVRNAELRQTWYDIEVGAFTNQLPAAGEDDMYGVYVDTIGAVCGSSYPWDGEVPPRVYEDLDGFID